jgi:HD-like signal output (HDOD) protein
MRLDQGVSQGRRWVLPQPLGRALLSQVFFSFHSPSSAVNELMTMLRNALATRDPVKQKEAIQKVIGE